MNTFLLVFLGGGIGAVLRYGISCLAPLKSAQFPWSTLVSNVLAALIAGALVYSFKSLDPKKHLLLVTGFCGGLSTFSTFSVENIQLFQRGDWTWATCNIVLNTLLSLFAVWLFAQHSSVTAD